MPGGTQSAGPYELRLPIFLQPLGGALKNRSAAPASPPCFRRRRRSAPLLFESTLATLYKLPDKTETPVSLQHWSSWWARVDYASRASKKAPQGPFCRRDVWRRALRVALADFSATPWRGLEKSERCPSLASLFPPQADGLRHPASAAPCLRIAGRGPNNSSLLPPLAALVVVAVGSAAVRIHPWICFEKFRTKEKLQHLHDAGVFGGAKQPKSEPLPSGASLAAISSKVMVFVPSL